ncbi:MAG TPA: 2'-deoxycytidine 5'-triphosphate deaminase [Planctomycetota bacterium]|nr:2'-deoxycytidine 5'-triphosphate deaminase [Planctomycetota bacterium]
MRESAEPTGTLESEALHRLVASGAIASEASIGDAQVQPSSIDLTLGSEAYRLPGSVLPLTDEPVRALIDALALERLDLSQPVCLGRDQVYLVRLRERLRLPPGMEAYTNSKSTTGRVDMATRVLADGSCRYDRIPAGYAGDLWIEIIPRSFHVVAQAGVSLNQAIFFRDRRLLGQDELVGIHGCTPLMREPDGSPTPAKRCILDGRLVMTADLDRPVVGWVAKRTHQPLVLSKVAGHAAEDFFTPITRPRAGYQFLEQGRFYILATRERVVVPADLACEMVPYDASAGEFRAHYAGFFDPGFGVIDGKACGATAVLEVRPHEDDLILRHGQPICAMAYERLTRPCTQLYGTRSNTYASQVGPKLSKHFA